MSYLLDTCALFALTESGRALSAPTRRLIEAPHSEVWISAISAFEIAQKHHHGRLTLPLPPEVWFRAVLEQHQVQELPLTSTIGALAAALPPIHRDPFDRLILATALNHQLTIITSYQIIQNYPGIRTLW